MTDLLRDVNGLSPDINGYEKERRMASLNPSHHRIKLLFNVPDKDDSNDGNDGDDGEENGDGVGDDEKDRNKAALTLTRLCWCICPASCDGDGHKGNDDEDNGDEVDDDGNGYTGDDDDDTEQVMMVRGW